MRVFLDREEIEPDEPKRDREVTLGAGTLFGIFCSLILLCVLCFGLGYAVGRRGPQPALIAAPRSVPGETASPVATGAASKPSAAEQSAAETPAQTDATAPQDTALSSSAGATSAQTPSSAVQPEPQPLQPVTQPAAQPPVQAAVKTPIQTPAPVRPALAAANPVRPAISPATSAVRPALSSVAQLMVQIAAVRDPGDAAVLIGALRKRGYEVNVRREQSDGFYHVRIGPFRSRADAEAMQNKLLNDGYNAIVQP